MGHEPDFLKVFKLLNVAQKHKLKKEEMIKKIFVFSDMQFDDANRGSAPWSDTPHETAVKKFEAAGYDVPELVYWNIQGVGTGGPGPVQADTPGVEMMSGFSASLMKSFLGQAEVEEMEKAEEEEYDDVDEPV